MATKCSNVKKNAFLAIMERTLGNITASCKEIGIERSTYYRWLEKDAKFKQAVDDLSEMSVDFAESQLKKQIKDGDTTATIFYLKTKGKHRGYSEKVEFDGTMHMTMQQLSPAECRERLKELEEEY